MIKKQKTVKKKIQFARQIGYILPAVIALGLGIATISVTAMRAVTDGSARLTTQYYDVLAREAAQSGVAAVKSCVLSKPAAWAETVATQISSSKPIMPTTDCDGAIDPSKSTNIVNTTAEYDTTYRVTRIEKAVNSTTIYVTSIGEVRIKAMSRVVSTVTSSVRAMATSVKPVSGPVSKDMSMISTGDAMACAVTNAPDSWVYCWGSNANLQLGTGRIPPTTAYTYPVEGEYNKPLAVASNATPLTAIGHSGCTGFGVVGSNCLGGVWRQPDVLAEPVSAMAGKKVTKVSVGKTHVCAVATDAGGANGKAYCWGKNNYGQLGNQSTADSRVPVQVNDTVAISALSGKTVVDVVTGDGFSCAKTLDNEVTCWGLNSRGQLGTGDRTDSTVPVAISRQPYESAVPRYCTGYWSWPLNGVCRFWNIPEAIPEKPASALIGEQVKALATLKGRAATMCVITMTDKTVCWGENFAGQVGDGASLPARATGSGSANSGNANQCPNLEPQARSEAINQAESRADLNSRVALRPSLVSTSLVFTSIKIIGGDIGDTTYVDVVGRTATTAASNPDRLFNWGGAIERDVTSNCTRNSDTYGGDSSRATASASITFTGRSTPSTSPLYNATANAPLNTRLGLTAGNPVRGMFCATILSMNQPYCDNHNSTANQGQLGNDYYCNPGWKTGSNGWPYYDNCDNRWSAPQSVRTDIAGDTSGAANPINISGRSITAIDSNGTDFTCMIAQASAWCWGVGASGRIGDGYSDNRRVPTAVNYFDSAIRVSGTSSGDPATWENPLWF